ncbi:MAG: bifunctional glutamate N-acetyltransferase/amino-acid acetyltransferase ArgJ [Syntrophobacteraceae bacterium]
MVSREPFEIPGFKAAAASTGMRYKDRLDCAIIVADNPGGAAAAGVFTTNRFCAAPVEICKGRLSKSRRSKGLVVNAGIANACTGEEGLRRAAEMTRMTAAALSVHESEILVASTGVIGQQIRLEPLEDALPRLVQSLRVDGWADAARAIMTTDLVPKMASVRVEIDGRAVTVGGIAKGSGMIAPNMATMLAFVCTDVAIEPDLLQEIVAEETATTFNCVTVDGDTSTNDTLLALASGKAGNGLLRSKESSETRAFARALNAVLLDLARQIVMDGEGATKIIEVRVTDAADEASAKSVAMTVANSPLVKTAFFGQDANWGRIVAAAGRAGVLLDPNKVTLHFDEVCVFRDGSPIEAAEVEAEASRVFKQKEILVTLNLDMGSAAMSVYTCDFSFDYVKINASYRS